MRGLVKRRLWIVVLALPLAASAGWTITGRLESRNEFCVACHLPGGTPLHEHKGADFAAVPAANLAAAHRSAESEFRCIDCHGGASFVNQVRVKAVAARDAGLWLLGWFEEPERMKHPLWDEDCLQCHGRYRASRDDDFHAIDDHNIDFAHRCVKCHLSHPAGGRPEFDFLDRAVVLPVCRNCHEEF